MRKSTAILLSVVMVMSVVAPSVSAQTATQTDTGPITYEYAGSPYQLVVHTGDLTGGTEFTVEYTTQGGPGTGTTVLARETYNTANLDADELLFYNQGAYESVNVTVSGYEGGEPTFETRSGGLDSVNVERTVVGTTGGDSDLTCDTGDKLGSLVNGLNNLDCTPQPGTTAVNTTNTDAEQVETDIYQSAQNQQASGEIYQTTLDNYLEDTQTQARIIGKNAYIRALNNGSSESAATTAAKQAVADYYATKQVNLKKQWDSQVANIYYLRGVAANESGVSDDFVGVPKEDHEDGDVSSIASVNHYDPQTSTHTLANGTSVDAQTVEFEVVGSSESGTRYDIKITDGNQTNLDDGGYSGEHYDISNYRVVVDPPTTDFDQLDVLRPAEYATAWSEIETQSNTVQSDMDTLATNTYDAYQEGEINNSDLVDPYVFSQEFSPGDEYQGWAAAQLTMLGANSPEAMDSVGRFNITTADGTQHAGILMSQENPASGQFENGSTYDPSQVGGTQYVVTDDQIHELTTNFTIDRIETTDGETRENVTIEKTVYETADVNVTELKEGYEELAYRRAQIEARESALAGGGGLFGGTEQSTLAIVAVAGAAILILRD